MMSLKVGSPQNHQMKLTGPAFRLFETWCGCSRPGNLSGTFGHLDKGRGAMGLFRWFQNDRSQPDANGNGNGTTSHMLSTFVARVADPAIRTVLLCGCGGGFDFVHSLTLYP